MKTEVDKIRIDQFGEDHWSLLAYVEYRALNNEGRLDLQHLRIKNGYWTPDGTPDRRVNPELLLGKHDDYDCLDDLENAGLIKSFGTGINPVYQLTQKGVKIMGELIIHKQKGGYFSNFRVSRR